MVISFIREAIKSKNPLERRFGITFGFIAAIHQIAYWIMAVGVSSHASIYEGEPTWSSGGPGSFFPWPKEPGMAMVMTGMDRVDQYIFYLIHYRVFPIIALGIIIGFLIVGRLVGRIFTKYNQKQRNGNNGQQ